MALRKIQKRRPDAAFENQLSQSGNATRNFPAGCDTHVTLNATCSSRCMACEQIVKLRLRPRPSRSSFSSLPPFRTVVLAHWLKVASGRVERGSTTLAGSRGPRPRNSSPRVLSFCRAPSLRRVSASHARSSVRQRSRLTASEPANPLYQTIRYAIAFRGPANVSQSYHFHSHGLHFVPK